jgi:hypothetical protein
MLKRCSRCKIEKDIEDFSKNKSRGDGHCQYCKICSRIYHSTPKRRTWRIKRTDSGIEMSEKRKYDKLNPWMSHYTNAKQRCTNPNNPKYKRYAGRNIKFLLTKEEVKALYIRDKAWLLDQPSIDRVNNDGNYTFKNCQFIEHVINTKKDKGRYETI